MICSKATRFFLAMALLTAVVGCSSDSPTEFMSTTSTLDQNADILTTPPETRVQVTAHLATIDADERLLTFDEVTEVVFVPEDCQIVRIEAGVETPLEFADLQVGDYLKVCGILEESGQITACKVVVYIEGECNGFDLIFQDSIATVDVTAGSFTVHGRTETIVVDENTVIWTIIPYQYSPGPDYQKDGDGSVSEQVCDEGSTYCHAYDTAFSVADLQVGWVVDIKAEIIDEATLLAVDIHVVTSNFKQAIQFEDCLSSIDYETRVVTFETEPWIGTVCSGATLLSAESEPLTLEDFVAGDCVTVRGVELAENTIRVCEMVKQ